MIDMGMGNDDGIDGRGIHRKRFAVLQPQFFEALKHATVYKHLKIIYFNQVFRPGNGSVST